MSFKYVLLLLIFLVGCSSANKPYQEHPRQTTRVEKYNEIDWQNFEPTILIKSKLQKKLIAIYMYSNNCVMCKRMESYTFADPGVIDIMGKYFINVKVNGEERPEIEAALNEAHIYPATILLAPDGTYLVGINGYVSAKQYSSSLMGIIKIAKDSGVVK